ncbi:MAG: diheme cytochrome c precursor [Aeoliella sp.]
MSAAQEKVQSTPGRLTTVFLAGVIAAAAIGYFVGISAGVPKRDRIPTQPSIATSANDDDEAIFSRSYAQMRRSGLAPAEVQAVSLEQVPQPEFNLFAEIVPDPGEKLVSLSQRSSGRAFNGAPPVIPHAVENTNDAACYACHGKGMVIEDRVARRMSHEFLPNCMQCHAPPPPAPFAAQDTSVENDFAGAMAPIAGKRAYPGAPPTIPHSTWMRNECISCHGGTTGWAGMESTHPWRSACMQCHAPSAVLDQAVASEVRFLSGPEESNP